ncbi:uncharacterized protein LOC127624845 [Xyrauchen texanus]|uniref:uncharacterized protein LOC127624845 n=1 Tax=Xyrauchen texanus TaxID=154827 RepID=UPI0022428B79|nr:uncharacterized protein LOC127624845 [Xyrauchen texanus]
MRHVQKGKCTQRVELTFRCPSMTFSNMWIFLFVWTAVAVLPCFGAMSTVLYPKINGSETLTCQCPDSSCQTVYWYRYLEKNNSLQFLMFSNSAGREEHGEDIISTRFKGSVSPGKLSYSLRISGLQEDEAGLYSCVFRNKLDKPVGVFIRPKVSHPTSPPPPPMVKTKKTTCKCINPSVSTKGCIHLVLWPSIGALLLLAVALAGTLYYYSRLPKKCRHRFAKPNNLR